MMQRVIASVEGVMASVDRWFARCWSRCPLAVMVDLGRWRLTIGTVKPGHVAKNPCAMALSHVERTGYPAAAWRKAMRSLAVWWARVVMLATGSMGVVGSGIFHRPLGDRWPVAMVWRPRLMVTDVLVKCAVQLASQSWPIESREPACSVGKRLVCRAFRGSRGKGRSPVWVEVMVPPLGNWTRMGVVVGWTSMHGPSSCMKWPFAPVSAIALSCG